MKAIVTILFSLALVLSHLSAFASPGQVVCQGKNLCGCGSSCCVKVADTAPAPPAPVPVQNNSRAQLLAAFETVASIVLILPQSSAVVLVAPVSPAPADVPLFIRNCSYLI
ncbi:MAG: hypothetical protein EBS05_00870 [Proteobacteria bacterium]|nr:hypothetical protein [Pseudomonadota bacterium]